MNKEFEVVLKEKGQWVDEALAECFATKFDTPDNIISAMKYSLFAGGKRLRPIMMIETCRCLGGDVDHVKKMACGLEMIHTYSLIHDDLPAMDDDSIRRGKPTSHIVYGEDIAILAGDALLNFAIETILKGPFESDYHGVMNRIKAMQVLFNASGINGMIGGQTGDILCESLSHITENHIQYVHEHKTGALFVAAVVCGGIIAGASNEEQNLLRSFATLFGLAFQIADDILDMTGTEEVLGKPINSDEKNHKTTFATLYGLDSSREKMKQISKEAKSILKQIDHDTSFLEELTDFVCERTY